MNMKKNLPMATRNSDLPHITTRNTETIDELLRRFPDGPALVLMVAGGVSITLIVLVVLYFLTVGVMSLDIIMAPDPGP